MVSILNQFWHLIFRDSIRLRGKLPKAIPFVITVITNPGSIFRTLC